MDTSCTLAALFLALFFAFFSLSQTVKGRLPQVIERALLLSQTVEKGRSPQLIESAVLFSSCFACIRKKMNDVCIICLSATFLSTFNFERDLFFFFVFCLPSQKSEGRLPQLLERAGVVPERLRRGPSYAAPQVGRHRLVPRGDAARQPPAPRGGGIDGRSGGSRLYLRY